MDENPDVFLGIKLEIEGNLDESCDLILINHQSYAWWLL